MKSPEFRIVEAVGIATHYGMIDGAHHKQWVIDQMLRAMMGKEKYKKWIENYNAEPDYDNWDEGIAP